MGKKTESVLDGEQFEIMKELVDEFVDGEGNSPRDPSLARKKMLMQKVQRDMMFADSMVIVTNNKEE